MQKRMLCLGNYKMQIGLSVIFCLTIVFFILTSPSVFLRPTIYLAYLNTIPFVGIMALGLTFVLASGEIDLSFPSVMAFAGYVCAVTINALRSVTLGVLAGIAAGAVIGVLNGLVIRKIGVPSIVVTLGMSFLICGVVNLLAQGLSKSLTFLYETPWHKVLVGKLAGKIPAHALWFLDFTVLFWFILYRHRFGNHVLFCGDNEDAARMMGIKMWTGLK